MHTLLAATISTPSPSYNFSLSFILTLLFLWVATYFAIKLIRLFFKKESTKKAKIITASIAAFFLIATFVHSILLKTDGMLFSSFTLYFFFAVIVISLFLQFFKKTASTLLSLVILGLIIMVVLFIRSLTAFTGSTKIATIRVLEKNKLGATLHIESLDNPSIKRPTIYHFKGYRFGLIIYQVIFSDTAVFLGQKTRYAWLGITGFDEKFKQTDLLLFQDFFKRHAIFVAIEKKEMQLPFVKSVQADIQTKIIAEKNARFGVYVENDGGVTVRREAKPN